MRTSGKRTASTVLLSVTEYVAMYGWALFVLLPFVWIVSLSLRKTQAVYTALFFQRLDEITLENYYYLFKGQFPYRNIQIFFMNALGNSVVVTSLALVGILIVSILAAYAFSQIKFYGRAPLFYFFLAGMMIPVQVVMLPLFKVVRLLGIQNGLASVILPYIAIGTPLTIFLLTGFFKNLPDALIEAARLEGASHLQVLTKIILPLSRPVIGAVVIFQFMFTWNEFPLALVLLQRASLYTLPIEVTKVQGQYMTPWNIVSTAVVAAIVPVIAIYLLFQRQFVSGITAGAMKE
jgi:raffinose/stachyose/melibiose transport system permease protein